MSGRMRRPKLRASYFVLGCGRRRWNCGASRRPIHGRSNGRRRAGKTGNSSCRGCRRSICRRSPPGRMHAISRPARWRTASPGGPGRRRPSRSADNLGQRKSTHSPCAGVVASSRASIAATSSFRRPTSTGSEPPTRRECGTLVRIEIDRATGTLRIAKGYSVLECGRALVPEVVRGQAQGGFAMGVGYTLLESLAALRKRARQRAVEPRAIHHRARFRSAADRP